VFMYMCVCVCVCVSACVRVCVHVCVCVRVGVYIYSNHSLSGALAHFTLIHKCARTLSLSLSLPL